MNRCDSEVENKTKMILILPSTFASSVIKRSFLRFSANRNFGMSPVHSSLHCGQTNFPRFRFLIPSEIIQPNKVS